MVMKEAPVIGDRPEARSHFLLQPNHNIGGSMTKDTNSREGIRVKLLKFLHSALKNSK
jgi:hypothetical protein